MPMTSSASFTRPANTAAYADGDLVANSATAASVEPLTFTTSRSTGLASIKAAYGLLAKLEEAVAAANVAPKTNGHDHTSDTGVAA